MAYLLRLEIEEFHDSLIIALIRIDGHKQNLEKHWKAVKKACRNSQSVKKHTNLNYENREQKTDKQMTCEVLKKIKASQNAFNNCLNS